MVILMGTVLVALNPGRQYKMARDAKRESDINAILNAINQYQVDNNGNPPEEITMETCPLTSIIGLDNLDLSPSLVASYIALIPTDPDTSCDEINSCYEICQTQANRITVLAPLTETRDKLSVTR